MMLFLRMYLFWLSYRIEMNGFMILMKDNLKSKIKFFIDTYEKVRKDNNYKNRFSIKWGYESQ